MSKCACGKTALYRFGSQGYCRDHRDQAVREVSTKRSPDAKAKFAIELAPKHLSTRKKQERRQGLLKANRTPSESKLIAMLAQCPDTVGKYEFQPMLKGFYPDFLNINARLIVELDGWRHFTPQGVKRGACRTAVFEQSGFRVITIGFSTRSSPRKRVGTSLKKLDRCLTLDTTRARASTDDE